MKWICKVCGYVHEGPEPPDICPVCKVGKERFERLADERGWEEEHKLGMAMGLDQGVVDGLREQLQIESSEVGMYLAMGRAADREGYPDLGEVFRRFALEEAEHAARLAELLGENLYPGSDKNLKKALAGEQAATKGKSELAELAKTLGYDAISDTVREMARDEARHGKALEGMLKRLFR